MTLPTNSNAALTEEYGVIGAVDQDTLIDSLSLTLAGQGSSKPVMVDLIEALSHHAPPVKRLLEQALTWKDVELAELPATKKCRIARQLRQVELDGLVEGYKTGKTVFQLAAQFGIDRRTVGRLLRKQGVDTTPAGLQPEDVPTAADLYRSGWSLARIGDKYGTASTTIRVYLLKAGVVMRKRRGS